VEDVWQYVPLAFIALSLLSIGCCGPTRRAAASTTTHLKVMTGFSSGTPARWQLSVDS
jgi:hypothetical protein